METHNQTRNKTPIHKKLKTLVVELLLLPIHGYRLLISPWLGPHCRFQPTCSEYALKAIREHGPFKGTYLSVRRIMKCHPWHPGGHDPVPKKSTSNKDNG